MESRAFQRDQQKNLAKDVREHNQGRTCSHATCQKRRFQQQLMRKISLFVCVAQDAQTPKPHNKKWRVIFFCWNQDLGRWQFWILSQYCLGGCLFLPRQWRMRTSVGVFLCSRLKERWTPLGIPGRAFHNFQYRPVTKGHSMVWSQVKRRKTWFIQSRISTGYEAGCLGMKRNQLMAGIYFKHDSTQRNIGGFGVISRASFEVVMECMEPAISHMSASLTSYRKLAEKNFLSWK